MSLIIGPYNFKRDSNIAVYNSRDLNTTMVCCTFLNMDNNKPYLIMFRKDMRDFYELKITSEKNGFLETRWMNENQWVFERFLPNKSQFQHIFDFLNTVTTPDTTFIATLDSEFWYKISHVNGNVVLDLSF